MLTLVMPVCFTASMTWQGAERNILIRADEDALALRVADLFVQPVSDSLMLMGSLPRKTRYPCQW